MVTLIAETRVLPLVMNHAELRQSLTPRALDLCRRMAREQSPKEVAEEMGFSEQHIRRLIRTLSERTGYTPLRLAMFGAWLLDQELPKREVLDVTVKNPCRSLYQESAS